MKPTPKRSRREQSDQAECTHIEQSENQSASNNSDSEPHKITSMPKKVKRRRKYKNTAGSKKVKH